MVGYVCRGQLPDYFAGSLVGQAVVMNLDSLREGVKEKMKLFVKNWNLLSIGLNKK